MSTRVSIHLDSLPRPQASCGLHLALNACSARVSGKVRPFSWQNIVISALLPALGHLHLFDLPDFPRPQEPHTYSGSYIHEPCENLSTQVDVATRRAQL